MASFRSFLARERLVPVEQLDRALQRQILYGEDLSVNLLEMGVVDEDELAQFLGLFHRLPIVTRSDLKSVAPDIIALLPAAVALRHRVCPVAVADESMVVAATRQIDRAVIDELERTTGKQVSLAIATPVTLAVGLHIHYLAELPARYQRIISRPPRRPSGTPRPSSLGPLGSSDLDLKPRRRLSGIILLPGDVPESVAPPRSDSDVPATPEATTVPPQPPSDRPPPLRAALEPEPTAEAAAADRLLKDIALSERPAGDQLFKIVLGPPSDIPPPPAAEEAPAAPRPSAPSRAAVPPAPPSVPPPSIEEQRLREAAPRPPPPTVHVHEDTTPAAAAATPSPAPRQLLRAVEVFVAQPASDAPPPHAAPPPTVPPDIETFFATVPPAGTAPAPLAEAAPAPSAEAAPAPPAERGSAPLAEPAPPPPAQPVPAQPVEPRTLVERIAKLDALELPSQVLRYTFRLFSASFRAALLFDTTAADPRLKDAFGAASEDHAWRGRVLPPEVLPASVRNAGQPLLARVEPESALAPLLVGLFGSLPANALFLPVVLGSRVVAVLYGDNREAVTAFESVREQFHLAWACGSRLRELVRRRRS